MLPAVCKTCGWNLIFNSPGYFEYHEKRSQLKKLHEITDNLSTEQIQRIIHFIDRNILKKYSNEEFQDFIGISSGMLEVYFKIRKAASTDLPVLILGESGTGKELTSLTIHEKSARKNKPFVTINCASIPENLLEAELFGYEKSSFTGAYKSKTGKFEYADGGAIFLDEIGAMSFNLQAKLLRFLQDKVVEKLGALGGKKVDVRIISATNCNIKSAIEEGSFRRDLYYRLNAFTISLPPVKERGDDKTILARYFLGKYCKEMGVTKTFTPEATEAIRRYDWPGNVREIINNVRRAIVMSDNNHITPEDLNLADVKLPDAMNIIPYDKVSLKDTKYHAEKERLREMLSYCNNNVSRAAEILGLSRQTIYNLKKKYSI